MGAKNIDVFDSSLQKTNLWLKDVEVELHAAGRPRAYCALRAVLHCLRDCMPVDGAAKFSSQMPLLVRGVFFDGWRPRRKHLRYTKARFLARLGEELRNEGGLDAALAARAVFHVLERHLSPGEIRAIRLVLPREVRQFWSQADEAPAPPLRPAAIYSGLGAL